jgi:Sec-independent protein translocase protein TatA
MFDSSFFQVVVFGVVGALLVGPKDLPMVAKKFGGVLGKGVGLISRSRNSVQSFIRENELTHVQQDFERSLQQIRQVQDEVKQGIASPILQPLHRENRTNYSSISNPAQMRAMYDSSSTSYRASSVESQSPSGTVQRSSLATFVTFQTSRINSYCVILEVSSFLQKPRLSI